MYKPIAAKRILKKSCEFRISIWHMAPSLFLIPKSRNHIPQCKLQIHKISIFTDNEQKLNTTPTWLVKKQILSFIRKLSHVKIYEKHIKLFIFKLTRPQLIDIPSLALSPVAPVRLSRSDPARSTKLNLAVRTSTSTGWF